MRVDELRLEPAMPFVELVKRLGGWGRAVTARLRGDEPETVGLVFDPAALPLELAVASLGAPVSVALVSARGVASDAADTYVSGGAVTWTGAQGRVRITAVDGLSSGTTYEARFEVRF